MRRLPVFARTEDDVKGRLGVLWVLLNASTEYTHDFEKTVSIMDAIEKFAPGASKAWNQPITIFLGNKVVFKREDISSLYEKEEK